MFAKLLLASDGSDYALRAAEAAAVMAKAHGCSVTVLHVFTMPVMQMAATGIEVDPGAVNAYVEEVQDSVARRTGRVLEDAGVPYDTLTEVGQPAEVIVRIAEDDGYDLIVLGSRGMTALKSFLLGSVSDKVCHHAHCPVLIVK